MTARYGAIGKVGLTDDVVARAYAYATEDSPPQWETEVGALVGAGPGGGARSAGSPAATPAAHAGFLARVGAGDTWWDTIHLVPRKYDLGFLLATYTDQIEVYSAHRTAAVDWTSFVNDAGDGVFITNLPALPRTLAPQASLMLDLQIILDGPPVIDGDLVFVVGGTTYRLHIDAVRSVVLPVAPVAPMIERLVFLTDVIGHLDGTEQRIALRDAPRQVFEVEWQVEGRERRLLENVIFDAHGRAVGFPMWHEPCTLAAAAPIGTTTITVDSTAYADWRAGGLGIIYADFDDCEALQVDSYGPTTVTFRSATTRPFAAGAVVMPVRAAYLNDELKGSRAPRSVQSIKAILTVYDEGVDLADATGIPTYGGRLLLSDANFLEGDLEEATARPLQVVDGGAGAFVVTTPQDVDRRSAQKRWVTRTRAALWAIRRLLHALHGRRDSFYLPTFYDDFLPIAALQAASAVLRAQNCGFAKHARSRKPRAALRVVKKDGTSIIRGIVSAAEVDEDEEQVTVDSVWGADVAVADVDRIELVERTRLDTDEPIIEHHDCVGGARVVAATRAVLE